MPKKHFARAGAGGLPKAVHKARSMKATEATMVVASLCTDCRIGRAIGPACKKQNTEKIAFEAATVEEELVTVGWKFGRLVSCCAYQFDEESGVVERFPLRRNRHYFISN